MNMKLHTAMTDDEARKAHQKCVRAFTKTAGDWGKDGSVAVVRSPSTRGRKWLQHFVNSDADVILTVEQPTAVPDGEDPITVGFSLMLGSTTSPRSDFQAAVTAVVDAAKATLKTKGQKGTRIRKSGTKIVVTTTTTTDAIANSKSTIFRFLSEAGTGMNAALMVAKPGKKKAYTVDYVPDAFANASPAVMQLRALIADVMSRSPANSGYAYPYAIADRVFRQMSDGMIRDLRDQTGTEPVYDIIVRECTRSAHG